MRALQEHSEYPMGPLTESNGCLSQPLHGVPPVRRAVRRSYDRGASRRRRATRPSAAAATNRSAGGSRTLQPTRNVHRHLAMHAQTCPEVRREWLPGVAATSAQVSVGSMQPIAHRTFASQHAGGLVCMALNRKRATFAVQPTTTVGRQHAARRRRIVPRCDATSSWQHAASS